MGFRRKLNNHDYWSALIHEKAELLADALREAVIRESAFRARRRRSALPRRRFT